jgi:hypothetical protein
MDHAISIQTEKIPWGSLYNMFKKELLILRKILTELLNKGFIRINSSFAKASVLFANKPGEGLRFYMDYKLLNEIIQKNRILLPFITKSLR